MMKGYKTWIGVGILGALGVYLLVSEKDIDRGITLIGSAVVLIGIGHKIEKVK